jgi:Fe-S cluster assembly iron-binding protein IscA
MKLDQVDRLPTEASFLTVTDHAIEVIKNIARTKPQGCFRIDADIGAKNTVWRFAWDDKFSQEDFVTEVKGVEIVMTATTIAYILDEYTLDYVNSEFRIKKNPEGALRHQQR